MSEHRVEAMKRVKEALNGNPPKSSLRYHPKFPDNVEAVVCQDCGVPLRGYVDDDRLDEVKEIAGQKYLMRRQVFVTFPSYTEALITFDDGSKHSTFGCRDCIEKLTVDGLEAKYASDLHDWAVQESIGKGPVDWLSVAYRKPVKVERVKP